MTSRKATPISQLPRTQDTRMRDMAAVEDLGRATDQDPMPRWSPVDLTAEVAEPVEEAEATLEETDILKTLCLLSLQWRGPQSHTATTRVTPTSRDQRSNQAPFSTLIVLVEDTTLTGLS